MIAKMAMLHFFISIVSGVGRKSYDGIARILESSSRMV